MELSPFGGFGSNMFSIVPIIIFLGFIFVCGTIFVRSIQGVKQWQKNNESPILTVDATVVAKRIDVRSHNHNTRMDNMHHHVTSSTYYYVTFEVASSDRLEFKVSGTEYGLLAENDIGNLTFQGTRYLGFERNKG